MKPKVFIGSSVEGLNIAYAIQQNLTHCAEPTVWDQGIFELSKTTIENLIQAVERSDFGIFVFSPDDETLIRGKAYNTVRDNVMFEMGLFLGKLSREKVFFIIPEGIDLHLPTDLLGMNAGFYNPNREDKSMQAATGPVCNQIRQVILKTPISSIEDNSNQSSIKDNTEIEDYTWYNKIFERQYSEAKKILSDLLNNDENPKNKFYETWLEYISLKEAGISGLDNFMLFSRDNIENHKIILLTIQMLSYDDFDEYAVELIENALEYHPDSDDILVEKIEALYKIKGIDAVESIIKNSGLMDNTNCLLKLSSLYISENPATSNEKSYELLKENFKNNRQHKNLSFCFSKILIDMGHHKEALYILDNLVENYPDEAEFYGYLSNACLVLDLYDKAMTYSKMAIDKYKENSSKAWVYYNIGNMFNNKKLYTEAEKWLRDGLDFNSDSEYAHQRLSSVIKSKTDENNNYAKIVKEGRILIPDL
jgi:tetratricopeptide (TPR) repeat protein